MSFDIRWHAPTHILSLFTNTADFWTFTIFFIPSIFVANIWPLSAIFYVFVFRIYQDFWKLADPGFILIFSQINTKTTSLFFTEKLLQCFLFLGETFCSKNNFDNFCRKNKCRILKKLRRLSRRKKNSKLKIFWINESDKAELWKYEILGFVIFRKIFIKYM